LTRAAAKNVKTLREELRKWGVTLPQEATDFLDGKGDKRER